MLCCAELDNGPNKARLAQLEQVLKNLREREAAEQRHYEQMHEALEQHLVACRGQQAQSAVRLPLTRSPLPLPFFS